MDANVPVSLFCFVFYQVSFHHSRSRDWCNQQKRASGNTEKVTFYLNIIIIIIIRKGFFKKYF